MIFYSGLRETFIVAFTTSSSAATLPVTFQCVEENLGVPNKIASFVLPLGATVNMNGTSLYQAVAAIFIAQFYGLDLSYSQFATILLTSMLAAVGTAPVPGVGIIMLIMVLQSVGIPAQGIGLILGVDRILDMLRTIPNIAGDAVVSLIVWKMETKKSK
jgi:Na+/H+-dicarboxylate symporter